MVTFAGIISGTGSLTQSGGSPLILTGTNTYTGGTTISAGTGLDIGNGGTSGSIVGNVTDDGFLTFNREDDVTFAGNVSGTGILRQEGDGTLTLTGLNSQAGGAGTLSVDKDAELGETGAAITLQGGELLTTTNGFQTARAVDVDEGKGNNTLAAATGTTATYTGVLSGEGALTVGDFVNDGTVVLASGANTYSGGTTVLAGATLSVNTDAELGATGVGIGRIALRGGELLTTTDGFSTARLVTLNPTDGANTLAATTGTIATYSGIFSGEGALTVGDFVDKGTVVLTSGANTYSGGTTVLGGGTLSVDTDAELGNASGGIILQSGGELLTTANFTSARSVSLNPVPLGVNIVTPELAIFVAPNILAAAANTTATYTGVVFGTGGLTIGDGTNNGTVVLASGVNTYFGSTTVFGATLSVDTDAELGDPSGGIILKSGGELLTTANFTSARSVSLNPVSLGAGIVTPDGPILVAPNILAAATNSTATYTGVVFGTGGLTIGDGTNNGTVVLAHGANTYFGGTTVVDATLSVDTDTELGDPSGGIILRSGGELLTTANFQSARTVSLNPGSLRDSIITPDSSIFAAPNILAGAANTTATYTGVVFGTGGLTIGDGTNNGTVVLSSGANTYFGGTTVVGATLSVDTDAELGDPSGVIILKSGGELLTTANFTSARSISLNPVSLGDSIVTPDESILVAPNILAAAANTTATYTGVVFGTGGLTIGDGTNDGTVVLASGANTYFGGTTVIGGATLSVNANAELGDTNGGITLTGGELLTTQDGFSSARAVTLNKSEGANTLAAATATTATYTGGVSGDGGLTIGDNAHGGIIVLTGNNTYLGGTAINFGTLQLGNGTPGTGSIVGDVINNAALVVNRSGTLELDGAISGTGNLSQVGSGTLVLTGTSTYTGATAVSAGILQVDGVLGNTAVTVQNAATLAGKGTIEGSVTILDGGHLAPGPGPQTLSLGTLSLNPASILDYQLGRPGAVGSGFNTLVNVAGNLTLDGVPNVTETEGGQFGSGAYRLLNYKGALTDLTLNLGSLPTGFSTLNTTVNTAVPGQVNLVVNAPNAPTQFWDGPNTVNDGTVHGGTGTWVNFTTTNFTNAAGEVNQAWQNGVAIFTAAPGTVTVGADILFQGIEFSSDGYTLVGSGAFALHPTGTAMITTDTDVTATIAAPIVGAGGLNKAGPGQLTLSGQNTYSGGTTISDGALSVASDTNLGAANVGLELNGGELETSADFATPRTIALMASLQGANILAAADNTIATYTGLISGAGGLSVGDGVNAGTVVLTNFNSYSGGTSILPGTLVAAGNDALGTGPVQLFNGTLMIPVDVTLPNAVTFVTGGVFNNAGTLNNNVLGGSTGTQTVINSGIINGNVTLGGATDIVQLFTGSKITGNLGLNGTNSTLILDGAGQQC